MKWILEDGIQGRAERYQINNSLLIRKLEDIGIKLYIDDKMQGSIITTFYYPENYSFSFNDMYEYIKERDYAIYPGKVTDADTFRIGNIGEIYQEDILKSYEIKKEFLKENKANENEAIIFDWAGTTVDYGYFAPVQAFLNSFKEFGIEPTINEVRAPMGMLKRDHIKTLMQMKRINSLWKEIHGTEWTENDINAVYDKSEKGIIDILQDFSQPKPFVLETVSEIRSQGIKTGSTTGYTDEMMKIVSKKAKEYGYEPDIWFSPNSVNNLGRPYPYMIFKNISLNVMSVENVIKAGDTVADIKEAKNAGVIAVGIIEGSSEAGLSEKEFNSFTDAQKKEIALKVTQKFKAADADYVISDIRGILNIIK